MATELGVPSYRITAGNLTYHDSCEVCHGPNGDGIHELGIPRRESAYVQEHSDEELFRLIVEGRKTDDPENTTGALMPPRGAQGLSDRSIRNVVYYLRAIQDPSEKLASIEPWDIKSREGETEGDYDGEWIFINDKINARVAVIDLYDRETMQIVMHALTLSDHGGTFVTPNTEYIIEGGQYAVPLGSEYAPISEYKEKYKGSVTLWKFDRKRGRIDKDASFAIELPPYWQDLSDAGKLASDSYSFMNSLNSELATGGI